MRPNFFFFNLKIDVSRKLVGNLGLNFYLTVGKENKDLIKGCFHRL